MKEQITKFFNLQTNRDVLINTVGNYLNVAFIAFFALVLVRIMTPAQYGVLSVLLGIAYVLANVLDFGTTATIYSYLPAMIEKKTTRVYQFIKTIFSYQSIFSLIVIAILFITFPYLDRVFFKTHAPKWELYITAFSVLFLIWQNFVMNILFAAKKFLKANIYNNAQNLIKTLLILFLIYLNSITVGSVIFIFGIVGPVIFFLLLFLEKKDLVFILLKSEVKKEEFRFSYTISYFVGAQFFNLGLRMDLFMLSYFGLRNEVGYYGLSQKIILSVITTVISITQVLSPNFSRIRRKKDARYYLKNGFLYLLLPIGIFLILFMIPDQVYHLFFTEKFAQTAPITRSLVFPFLLFTLGNIPNLFVLYTFKKPSYILVSNIIFFFSMTIGCYLLIPKFGVFAPAYVIAFSMLGPILIQSLGALYEYKKLPE